MASLGRQDMHVCKVRATTGGLKTVKQFYEIVQKFTKSRFINEKFGFCQY